MSLVEWLRTISLEGSKKLHALNYHCASATAANRRAIWIFPTATDVTMGCLRTEQPRYRDRLAVRSSVSQRRTCVVLAGPGHGLCFQAPVGHTRVHDRETV